MSSQADEPSSRGRSHEDQREWADDDEKKKKKEKKKYWWFLEWFYDER